MRKRNRVFTLGIFSIAVLLACKKEQPSMPGNTKDPCGCASEVSADFVIEEQLNNVPDYDWVETDTTLHNKDVQFRALEEDAEYKWYIGIDTFATQTASRFFSDQWIGYDIPITLVVKKEPNKTCFPDDDGYDSITKTFHVSQYMIDHGYNDDVELGTIEGTYRVFSKELNDSIDIFIDVVNVNSSFSVNLINIDGSGNICGSDVVRRLKGRSYREIRFDDSYSDSSICPGLSGIIRNKINGKAELLINSSRWEGSPSNIFDTEYQYFGRKLSN